jgi:hypothetical protein
MIFIRLLKFKLFLFIVQLCNICLVFIFCYLFNLFDTINFYLFICYLIIYLFSVHYCNLFVYYYTCFFIFINYRITCVFSVYFCYIFVLFGNINFYLFICSLIIYLFNVHYCNSFAYYCIYLFIYLKSK